MGLISRVSSRTYRNVLMMSNSSKEFLRNPRKLIPCRYFLLGQCSKGDSCNFSHSSPTATEQNLPDGPPICSYFLQGNCARGDTCRFQHVSRSQLKNSTRASNQGHPGSKNSSPKVTSIEDFPSSTSKSMTKKPSSFAEA